MNYSTRKAFTLIELVISIVIIAIASVTLPMMLSSANKLEERSIHQDIFYKSTAIMTQILSLAYWDTKSKDLYDDEKGQEWSNVLDVLNGDSSLQRNSNTSNLRVGSFDRGASEDYRQFYSYTLWSGDDINDTNASTIPSQAKDLKTASINTLDDWNAVYLDETSDEANVYYDVAVSYVDDNVTTDATNSNRQIATWTLSGGTPILDKERSTNLKRINVVAKRNIGSEDIQVGFAYFSSNIGVAILKKK